VANTVDPLGGSYFVEKFTLDMEKGAFDYFDKLDAMGGMVKAIEKGYPQKEIAEASYQFQKAAEAREKVIVGANEFLVDDQPHDTLYIDESVAEAQTRKLKTLRERRDNAAVERALDALKKAASQEPEAGRDGQISPVNTMPFILEAVKAYATVGEICDALRTVYGTYEESAFA
jgi:methylmalonyl-CoA mutase, N-terminal domain